VCALHILAHCIGIHGGLAAVSYRSPMLFTAIQGRLSSLRARAQIYDAGQALYLNDIEPAQVVGNPADVRHQFCDPQRLPHRRVGAVCRDQPGRALLRYILHSRSSRSTRAPWTVKTARVWSRWGHCRAVVGPSLAVARGYTTRACQRHIGSGHVPMQARMRHGQSRLMWRILRRHRARASALGRCRSASDNRGASGRGCKRWTVA